MSRTFRTQGGVEVRAVDGLNLVAEDREFVVLVGPSGCGKTTTLRLIAGLEEPTSGEVSLDGRSMRGVSPKDRDIAMVFQHFALYPHMTVEENLSFGLRLRKCPRREREARVGEVAEALDLAGCLRHRPRELSGGQRQRVALGRAMVRQPKVFLFDEPLSNLDAQMRAQTRIELARLHSRLGATMIYVTHDQMEAMMLGQRVAVMKDGAIQQIGKPLEVYRHPGSRFVAGFLGSPPMNFFRGRISRRADTLCFEEEIRGEPGRGRAFAVRLCEESAARMHDREGQSVWLGIRPEHIAPVLGPPKEACEQTVECGVEVVQPMGPETFLTLASAAHQFVARSPASIAARSGQTLPFVFDMKHAQFFDAAGGEAII